MYEAPVKDLNFVIKNLINLERQTRKTMNLLQILQKI